MLLSNLFKSRKCMFIFEFKNTGQWVMKSVLMIVYGACGEKDAVEWFSL